MLYNDKKYETLFTPGNENLYHHWLIYECDSSYEYFLKNNTAPKPGPCFDFMAVSPTQFDPKWNTVLDMCQKISLVWAIGGDAVTMKF